MTTPYPTNTYGTNNDALVPSLSYIAGSTPPTPAVPAPHVAAPSGGSSAYSASTASLQQQLNAQHRNDAGYVPLVVDGILGPKTKAAQSYAPAAVPSATPTAAQIYDIPGLQEDPKLAAARGAAVDYSVNGDSAGDDAVRSKVLQQFQGEIDATNAIYAEKLRQAKLTGSNRVGSSTAIQARRGLLGSDFGAAQTDTVNSDNNQIYGGIGQEQKAAVSAILNHAGDAAAQAIKDKNDAMTKGLDARLKYYEDAGTRKTQNTTAAAQFLVQKGYDLAKVPADVLSKLATSYGVSPEDVKAAYSKEKETYDTQKAKDAADIAKATQYNLSPGEARYDASGKRIAFNPKAAASTGTALGGAYVPGSDPTVDAYVKGFGTIYKASDIPAKYKGLVAQGVAQQKQTVAPIIQNISESATSLLQKLDQGGADYAVGATSFLPTLPGTKKSDFVNQFKNLKALLALDNVKLLKGQGAISDAERKTLDEASANLSRSQSPAEFRKELNKVIGVFAGKDLSNIGADTSGLSETQPQSFTLPGGAVVHLQADGTYQ